jgi:hypothetical protein
LLLSTLKWRNLTKKDYGKPLQPSTWDTLLKTLFSKFNEEGINYKHTKHFNKDSDFHAMLMLDDSTKTEIDIVPQAIV